MIARAAPRVPARPGGSRDVIGSVVTHVVPAGSAVYSGTKGAVDAITGVLVQELGPRRICVNALNPDMIVTEGTQGTPESLAVADKQRMAGGGAQRCGESRCARGINAR
ncbi:SDR family oxidoreductase [Luteimonas salinisoli]|uniref:SDR family oxidoreductase n=1 Tax=Luteimonas salinisoli TaxID=2752307 RepID=UPI001C5CA20A|nr:SDR family oxidoreductase [Luteimonas salinisoli]